VEGKVRPGSDVIALSKIPDRAGMLAQLVTIILGPGSTIAGQIKSLTEKLEKEEAGATA
jgi:large subunit ribosomal protein L10